MTAVRNREGRWQVTVSVRGDHRLMRLLRQPGGIAAWNRLVGRLAERNMLGAVWGTGDEPPLIVAIDLAKAVFPKRLDGIDLTHAWLGEADLSGRSLRGAKIGCCPGASLHAADLTGAILMGDLSGAEFDHAVMDGVACGESTYDRGNPPRSFPHIDRCRAMDWSQPAGRPGRLPWIPLRAKIELLDLAPLIGDSG